MIYNLIVEKAVIEAILYEKQPYLGKIVGDNNNYTFGRIRDNDVTIIYLLIGIIGKASATSKLSSLVSYTSTRNATTTTAINKVYKVLIVPDTTALLTSTII